MVVGGKIKEPSKTPIFFFLEQSLTKEHPENILNFIFAKWSMHDCDDCHLSRLMTKPTKWHVRPAKTQLSEDSVETVVLYYS